MSVGSQWRLQLAVRCGRSGSWAASASFRVRHGGCGSEAGVVACVLCQRAREAACRGEGPGQGWARRRLRRGARCLLGATFLLCDTRRLGRRVPWALHGWWLRASRGYREEEVLGSSSGPFRIAFPTQAAEGVGLQSRCRLTGAVCLGPADLSASRGEEERASAGLPTCPWGPRGPVRPLASWLPASWSRALAPCLSARLVTAPWPPALASPTRSRPRGGSPPRPVTTPPDLRALKAGPWGSSVLRRS